MKRAILLPGLVLCINFLATIFYLFLLSNQTRKKYFYELPVWVQKSVVLLFVGPLFVSPFLAQPRINILAYDWLEIPFGTVLFFGGLILIILAFLKIGVVPSLREKSVLITTGVYKLVRHPIYAGTILAFGGLILLTRAGVVLFYFPLVVGLYFIMTVYEEKTLMAEYGWEYNLYQKKTRKRIIPYIL